MSYSQLGASSDPATPTRPVTKKRKIRKGTTSCWECKHRKTRCEWLPLSGSICVFCQRRGLLCTSQELPNPFENGSAEDQQRPEQTETSADQLIYKRRTFASQLSQESRTPDDQDGIAAERTAPTEELHGFGYRNGSRAHHLFFQPITDQSSSAILRSALPKPGVAALIFNRGKYFSLPFHWRQQPGRKPQASASSIEQLVQVSKLPKPNDHPVHFARKLLQLAVSLQELDASDKADLQLDQPVHDAARRFMDIASSLVTSYDSLVDSLDGLETLMLEACYHINAGNLRGAWLTFRRALSIAQLVDLPRLAERAGTREESLWFRLMYGDRFLSVIMGLPHAITDDNFMQKYLVAADLPTEKLDRVHFIALGRIIARNVRMQRSRRNNDDTIDRASGYDHYKETRNIDFELKEVAKKLTLKWWNSSSVENLFDEVEATEITGKLVAQMHHYFLLVTLHLPILMHQLPTGRFLGHADPAGHFFGHPYSETAVLAASREVLTRFIVLRDLHRTLPYRALDDKAVIASMGLIFVHLNGHCQGLENALEHQRPSDLGLVQRTIDTMKRGSSFEKNVLGNKDVAMLEALLGIEADAVGGNEYSMWMSEDIIEEGGYMGITTKDVLRLSIPYFGMLHIHRQHVQRPQSPEVEQGFIWMEESASAPMNTVENIPQTHGNEAHFVSSTTISTDQIEIATDISYQAMYDAFFQEWIPGEAEMDESNFEIGTC